MQEIHDKNISELYKKTDWVLRIFHFISGSNVAWHCPAASVPKVGCGSSQDEVPMQLGLN